MVKLPFCCGVFAKDWLCTDPVSFWGKHVKRETKCKTRKEQNKLFFLSFSFLPSSFLRGMTHLFQHEIREIMEEAILPQHDACIFLVVYQSSWL